jgi:hypothetical protein
MNTPCKFDKAGLIFAGSPIEQARCLLRFVKRAGNVDDIAANLPAVLETLLAAPSTMEITRTQVRQYLAQIMHDGSRFSQVFRAGARDRSDQLIGATPLTMPRV